MSGNADHQRSQNLGAIEIGYFRLRLRQVLASRAGNRARSRAPVLRFDSVTANITPCAPNLRGNPCDLVLIVSGAGEAYDARAESLEGHFGGAAE